MIIFLLTGYLLIVTDNYTDMQLNIIDQIDCQIKVRY